MITVSGLTRQYGKRLAVDDMTFDVAAGRVTGFVGPNGAGKSTTLRMMVGRPESARVFAGYTAVALIVGSVLLYRGDTGSRIQQLPTKSARRPELPASCAGRRGPHINHHRW
jgi:ABC-type branched-subunit amino acid transport system ATPase component